MTAYTKTTDFAAKDALSTGNPSKLVKGTEIDTEFANIATADATSAKKDSTNTFTAAQTISADLNVSGDVVLTGAGKGIIFEGTTADAHESTLLAGEPTSDVTITMPVTTTTLAGLSVAQTFTVDQSFAGDIILTGAGKGVIFEGTTADANETTLVAGEPTADRTVTLPDETCTLGFRNVIQNSQSDNYTLVLTDSGKHIYETGSGKTVTIPANASVAFPIGTSVTFISASNAVTIAITSDTLTLASAGTTGSRTLAANSIATAVKVTSTAWIITGNGLT